MITLLFLFGSSIVSYALFLSFNEIIVYGNAMYVDSMIFYQICIILPFLWLFHKQLGFQLSLKNAFFMLSGLLGLPILLLEVIHALFNHLVIGGEGLRDSLNLLSVVTLLLVIVLNLDELNSRYSRRDQTISQNANVNDDSQTSPQDLLSGEGEIRREEIRGIFTLGILAILFTLRDYLDTSKLDSNSMLYALMSNTFLEKLIPFAIDFTLVFWLAYAIFMVFGFSQDIIGVRLSEFFRNFARLILGMTFSTFFFILNLSLMLYLITITDAALWVALTSILLTTSTFFILSMYLFSRMRRSWRF